MSDLLRNSKKSLVNLFWNYSRNGRERDVQKWDFWHQLISFICDMQLGPFSQEVLCFLVNTVNCTHSLVSVEQNHWNKYMNLSLVCQYICPDRACPLAILYILKVWLSVSFEKIHLSMTFKNFYSTLLPPFKPHQA